MSDIVNIQEVEERIIVLRDQKVMLDSDVAALYQVETRDINKAVSNNPDKFPVGYLFKITKEEKAEVVEIFHHLHKLKFSPQLSTAFTERGLYMLATILKSERATQTTLAIVDTFANIRELSRTVAQMSQTTDENTQKSLMQKGGDIMADILGSELHTSETETTFKLNLAVLSFEHTTKRTKPQ